ncbi:MAG: DEAD/DEAH box helicase family protein [Alphaproteobacteria bacterium]|nr:DEAD/DEAH box helicase family protein [Alphaproteobacteria bacterium]
MPTLESTLILHPYICAQFGHSDLRAMLQHLKDLPPDDANGPSRFAQALLPRLSFGGVGEDKLQIYDENIAAHSRALGMRGEKSWKPFQYAAMLFTERYLDLYFSDEEALLADLNSWRTKNSLVPNAPPYTPADLRTLAFQSATGSGKTLLLHANILQYKHHLKESGGLHKLNKIILVTPDEGMSRQHLAELHASNLEARLFSDEAGADVFSGGAVEIIDLHKLDEKKGVKRVALGAFEDNNLVMVDEGHLGSGGTVWRNRRKQLASNGFTFEYSATFNQVTAGGGAAAKTLREQYAKSVLFDYSYRFFHEDGYGKDYKISNLRETDDGETNRLYLLACLLMFYQQCKIYAEESGQLRDFNIAKPLWVFLGRTVTGEKKEQAKEKNTVSDIGRIVKFLAWALDNPREVADGIKSIMQNTAGLVDEQGAHQFRDAFHRIFRDKPKAIYDGICDLVFNGRGRLHVSHLPGADELQLSAGGAQTPFAVINVGDAPGLYTQLDAMPGRNFTTAKSEFAAPLFRTVDNDSSPANIAIGARKFAAGWNSWRVSTMGLMHVGTGEGPQIIQMFGRGVRLKGHGMSLKRHTQLEEAPSPPSSAHLRLLETLNIFGMKANYMEEFKKYLRAQGIGAETVKIPLRTKAQFGSVRGLKILRKREDAGAFEYSRERISLPDEYDRRDVVTVDRYKRLQTLQAKDAPPGADARERHKLEKKHLDLLNKQRVWRKILARKQRANWHNMLVSRERVDALLDHKNKDWYELFIPPEKLEAVNYARVREWENLAADLICAYADKYWRNKRNEWEHKYIVPAPLEARDPNFISEYVVSVAASETALIAQIEAMAADIEKGKYQKSYDLGGARVNVLNLGFHAYAPLLHARPDAKMKITPVPLNDGEKIFVECLKDAVKKGLPVLAEKEIFLMRNMSRGRGISFFNDCAFYPDFILWVKDRGAQNILFIDPKGLVHNSAGAASKIDLHRKIKDTQKKLQDSAPELILHSYVWTTTHPRDIGLDNLRTPSARHKNGVYLAQDGSEELPALLNDALGGG